MSGSSNFLQFDSALAKAMSDANYLASLTRQNGFSDGLAETALFDKAFAQFSTMAYAVGQVLANLGYTISDSNAANLITAITASMTPSATGTDVLTGTNTLKPISPAALASLWLKGSDLTAAGTVAIPTTGGYFRITGNTTISGFSGGLAAGQEVTIHFTGTPTLTYNATSFILPTSANIAAAAGDIARFRCIDAVNQYWRCVGYLKADGTPLAALAANGSSLVLISTATASASSSVAFTSGINSTYDHYIIEAERLVFNTSDTNLEARVSEDGGSTWKSGAGNYAWGYASAFSSGLVGGSSSDTKIILMDNRATAGFGTTAGYNANFEIHFYSPSSAAAYKMFRSHSAFMDSSNRVNGSTAEGAYLSTNAINGVQLFPAGGTITSGNFYLYGVKKS